jgi:chromatin remodeling complex protein RSC6
MAEKRFVSKQLAHLLSLDPDRGHAWKSLLVAFHGYVKKHGLRDPKDGRRIRPNKTMAAVTGSSPFDQFKIPRILLNHSKPCPE